MATKGENFRLLERMFQMSDKDKDGRLSVVRGHAYIPLERLVVILYRVCVYTVGRILAVASIDKP